MKQILIILALILLFGLGYFLVSMSNQSEVSPQPPVVYSSEVETFSTDSREFTIQYSSESEYAQLGIDGTVYDLERAVSASGAKYANEDESVIFWEHQGEAMVEINGEMIFEGATVSGAQDENLLTFNVDSQKVDCVGVGPMECLVVNGEYFYDSIQGFEFEPGFNYVLLVERTERENVPADASAYVYTLVQEVSKTPETEGSSLENTSWVWEETLYSNDDVVTPNQTDAFVLTFSKEGRFSATTDCNNLIGSYVSPNAEGVNFVQVASTKKACLDGSQESDFIQMLDQVSDYVITEEGRLALTLELDTGTMLFTPAVN